MIKPVCFLILSLIFAGTALAQPAASPSPTPVSSRPQRPLTQTQTAAPFELSEYGVSLQPDARLIIMMAALEAAGFDPTPAVKEQSRFPLLGAKQPAKIAAAFREKLQEFFARKKFTLPATAGVAASLVVF